MADYDIVPKSNNSGASFPPLEPDTYPAICYAIIGIGSQFSKFYGKYSEKVIFIWEIPDETIVIDGAEKPRAVSEQYTNSLNEKANMRKMLEGWRGQPFTDEEIGVFGLKSVLGCPCVLNTILETAQNGNKYPKVSSVAKFSKRFSVPDKPYNDLVFFDIANPDADLDDMRKFPQWIQDRIKQSKEYQERLSPPAAGMNSDVFAPIQNDEDLPF